LKSEFDYYNFFCCIFVDPQSHVFAPFVVVVVVAAVVVD